MGTTPHVAFVADTHRRADREKGVSRYIRSLYRELRRQNTVSVDLVESPHEPLGGYDVVHLAAPRVRYLQHYFSDTPTVLTVHGLDFHFPPDFRAPITEPKTWLYQRLISRFGHRADAYLVASDFLLAQLLDSGIPREQIHKSGFGVDHLPNRDVDPAGGHYILTDTPVWQVVEAFRGAVDAGYGGNLRSISERGYGDRAHEHAQRRGLADRYEFTGYVPERRLPSHHAGADAFIHWSGHETFGFPPLEAMACGTPVITNDAGSLPEVVGDGGCVVTTPDEAAAELEQLLDDPEYRESRVAAGFEWASRWNWSDTAKDTRSVYTKLV